MFSMLLSFIHWYFIMVLIDIILKVLLSLILKCNFISGFFVGFAGLVCSLSCLVAGYIASEFEVVVCVGFSSSHMYDIIVIARLINIMMLLP